MPPFSFQIALKIAIKTILMTCTSGNDNSTRFMVKTNLLVSLSVVSSLTIIKYS